MIWPQAPLGQLCDVLDSRRKPVTKRDRLAGEFPYYGATGILDCVNDYIFDEKLVLIGEDGAKWGAGEKTAFAAEGKYWVNNHAHVIRPDRRKVMDEWIIYFLNFSDLSKFITGLTVPKLNQGKLCEIPIPLPPLPEQQRIVAILDDAFAGLSAATANAEKNLKNARELFESYLYSVFVHRNEEWATSPIGDIADVFDGPHATPKTVDAGPVFLGISALKDGVVDLAETRHVSAEDFKKWTRRVRPHADDVVFSYETRLGQAAIIPEGLDCCLGRRMGLVRCDRSKIEPRFFLYQYLAKPFQDFLRSKTVKGATVDRISIKEFPAFEVKVARLAEQRETIATLDSLAANSVELDERYRRKVLALADLKQSILQKAFSGDLTSPPSQAIKEAAE